jgi:hypothetical protein
MGQTLQLTAIVGITNPTYQWQVTNSSGAWFNLASTLPSRMTTNSTLTWQNFTGAFSSFRAVAKNISGSITSSVAVVTLLPAPPPLPTNGLWTVNFAITPPDSTPYHGPGVLGTNLYWNGLSGSQFTNTPPSLLDDGVTVSGINFGSMTCPGGPLSSGTNNVLLDNFCVFYTFEDSPTFGLAFVFTSVPVGIYKLALYGINGADVYSNYGFSVIFSVQGVSQYVTNAQDLTFASDNTVIYTNLTITNGTLEVDIMPDGLYTGPGSFPIGGNNGCAFNGAQLQLITCGPDIQSMTNSGRNMVLTYVGGQLLEATNMSGPWTTNLTATSPFTISPTGQMKFYRVYTNNFSQ